MHTFGVGCVPASVVPAARVGIVVLVVAAWRIGWVICEASLLTTAGK